MVYARILWGAGLGLLPAVGLWAQESAADGGSNLLWRLFVIFLVIGAVSFVLLGLVSLWLIFKAKNLIEQAVRPDLATLERRLATIRRRHPELDDEAVCKLLIRRHAFRSGLVGFVTGFGGLPTLPLTLPIDVAVTIRIQASLAHMLRMVRGVPDEEIDEAGLWVLTAGGQELASFSGAAVREMLVKAVSRTFLKFIPLIGGIVGFGLNWLSTQALGRLVERWLRRYHEGQAAKAALPSLPAEP